jgi:phage N-6-adenine-methyltransferase
MLSDQWQTPETLFQELNAEFNFDIDLCATKENSKCGLYYRNYLGNEIGNTSTDKVYYWSLAGHNNPLSNNKINCAFMNPPYSNPKPFIEKAWEDSRFCRIVCLVKCDPSTRWWSVFWDYDVDCYSCYKNDDLWIRESPLFGKISRTVDCPYCKDTMRYSGPTKPGCEVRFFPKRIQFDPPRQLIDDGSVWKVGNKWVKKCDTFGCMVDEGYRCHTCKGKGYIFLSGPTFPSALLIFDRREP